MESRLTDPAFCRSSSPQLLREVFANDVLLLDSAVRLLWDAESAAAGRRMKANKIDALLEEFSAQLRAPGELTYESGFRFAWLNSAEQLYGLRWWITIHTAGVYFVYSENEELMYVGTSCGGTLGARLWVKEHEPYAHSADVILFDTEMSHFSLALEAFTISRLRPPKNGNGGFKKMWITPRPPYDTIWTDPDSV